VQAAVPVLPGDDEQALAARILQQEHQIFPHAIALYQQGRLEIRDRQVIIKGDSSAPNSSPLVNPPVVRFQN
jgi:phosphoribosylglycinamide formyltransferase-1